MSWEWIMKKADSNLGGWRRFTWDIFEMKLIPQEKAIWEANQKQGRATSVPRWGKTPSTVLSLEAFCSAWGTSWRKCGNWSDKAPATQHMEAFKQWHRCKALPLSEGNRKLVKNFGRKWVICAVTISLALILEKDWNWAEEAEGQPVVWSLQVAERGRRKDWPWCADII